MSGETIFEVLKIKENSSLFYNTFHRLPWILLGIQYHEQHSIKQNARKILSTSAISILKKKEQKQTNKHVVIFICWKSKETKSVRMKNPHACTTLFSELEQLERRRIRMQNMELSELNLSLISQQYEIE